MNSKKGWRKEKVLAKTRLFHNSTAVVNFMIVQNHISISMSRNYGTYNLYISSVLKAIYNQVDNCKNNKTKLYFKREKNRKFGRYKNSNRSAQRQCFKFSPSRRIKLKLFTKRSKVIVFSFGGAQDLPTSTFIKTGIARNKFTAIQLDGCFISLCTITFLAIVMS